MARLYRPHIPLAVRVKVAERQLRERGQGDLVDATATAETWGAQLRGLLRRLAVVFGCEVADLRLDHDPPLAARPRHRRGLNPKTFYTPDANDPDHLFYRPHGPEFDGSHLIKTNVRGDHGQHPDRVLIKKQRRLENPRAKKKSQFSTSRKIPRAADSAKLWRPKPKWPKRPFPRRRKER